jgi:hypothetical protein
METAMINEVRDTSGKFAPKSEVPRKVRSVNLTDEAWYWLATVAEKAGVSRNDYLEALAASNHPFMEMVESPSLPFIETVVAEIEVDGANMAQQPDSELLPFIETVRTEVDLPTDKVEAIQAENQRLHIELGNSASEKKLLKQELVELRSQLETKRASREEITNLAPLAISVESPDAATILSQLRVKRKKSTATLGDVEKILEILEASPEK